MPSYIVAFSLDNRQLRSCDIYHIASGLFCRSGSIVCNEKLLNLQLTSHDIACTISSADCFRSILYAWHVSTWQNRECCGRSYERDSALPKAFTLFLRRTGSRLYSGCSMAMSPFSTTGELVRDRERGGRADGPGMGADGARACLRSLGTGGTSMPPITSRTPRGTRTLTGHCNR